MNRLPEHRKALYGRTFGSTWSPENFDPIARYDRPSELWSLLLAVAVGIGFSVYLVAWWSS